MNKKIAIVVHKGNVFLSHRVNIAEKAIKEGYEVHVLTDASEAVAKEIKRKGIHFHQVPFSRTFRNIFFELKTLIYLFNIIRKLKPNLVHNVTIKPIIYVNLICKILRHKKIINSISGLGYIFVNKNLKNTILKFFVLQLYKFFFKSENVRIILQNIEEKKYLEKHNIDYKGNLRLVPGAGVNMSKYIPSKSFENKNIVVFAARMIREKGVEEVVNASEKLFKMNYNIKLILLGEVDEEYPTHIKKNLLKSWSKKNFIEWYGHVDNIIPFYQMATLVCMPSYYSEGVPKSLIEAAAIAKPIITTDMPGCRSIVKHNYNGLLVEPKNIASLVKSIKYLLDNPDICRTFGLNGRNYAKEMFDETKIVKLTLDIYNEII